MMPAASGRIELWRRLAILLGILLGMAAAFYVAPVLISITCVDFQQKQADELKTLNKYRSGDKILQPLPLDAYIEKQTAGQLTRAEPRQWSGFFQQVELASRREYGQSIYAGRVSEKDKDGFWEPRGWVPVFFRPGEIPYAEWGLPPRHEAEAFTAVAMGTETAYFKLRYEDYRQAVGAMSSLYRQPPDWLYHPYRKLGLGLMGLGLLLYLFLPRQTRSEGDIRYGTGPIIAGDMISLILLALFYGLPFLINGGSAQALTSLWPVTLVMWALALLALVMLYYSAWHASYRIELTPEALYLISWKGVKACRFDDIASADIVILRSPGWFRKLAWAATLLSLLRGRGSGAALAASASYVGLEIRDRRDQVFYVWFSDQWGKPILNNFDRVPQAIQAAGVPIQEGERDIEGFTVFM